MGLELLCLMDRASKMFLSCFWMCFFCRSCAMSCLNSHPMPIELLLVLAGRWKTEVEVWLIFYMYCV